MFVGATVNCNVPMRMSCKHLMMWIRSLAICLCGDLKLAITHQTSIYGEQAVHLRSANV